MPLPPQGLHRSEFTPFEKNEKRIKWWIDGSGAIERNPYETSFVDLLKITGTTDPHQQFDQMLRNRRQANLSNHVLDLFGSSVFLNDHSLADSKTGIRIDAVRGYIAEMETPPTIVLGDILNQTTWTNLDSSLSERGIPSLDLVTMRPLGGWSFAVPFRQLGRVIPPAELEVLPPLQSLADGEAWAIQFIVGQVLKRLSSTGRFYFSLELWKSHQRIKDNATLQKLVAQINTNTEFRLILKDHLAPQEQEWVWTGALIPKKDLN